MASKAKDFYVGLQTAIDAMIERIKPYRAKASAVTNGKVTIQPLESETALGEAYPRLVGPALDADDEVAVITLGGKPFVLGRIQRAANDGEAFDYPILIEADNEQVFTVGKADGTKLFSVDSVTPSSVGVFNGANLYGFPDQDPDAALWSLDSSSGDARFNAVEAASFNSPIVATSAQSSADTSSTTNTSTLVTAATTNIELTTGTWTIYAIGGAQFKHSAGGTVDFRVKIGADVGTLRGVSFGSSVYTMGVDNHQAAGQSGTVAISLDYRGGTAGTSSCKDPWLLIIATRTS